MPAKDTEIKRVGRFGAVGVINTIIDIGLLNVLTSLLGLALIPANIISTTCAMVFSYFANQRIVFKSQGGNQLRHAIVFFAVTAFGLYVLQSAVIQLLTVLWLAPVHLGVAIVRAVGVKAFSDAFLIKNGAKVAAVAVSLVWNYILYKKVVFRG